ncbi:DNA polymerase III subunit chi [Pararhizobium haloflavum]|uniref:DNA polymerase III subunit chi n=1 Tax=Pararhizobium haloflavum TaxID=2037914 RepID=UPI000C18358E|nr:DNA polymerase III subunit chi [Pararhizobium haloflavum]
MTDILFYHLTESRLEDAIPPLLEKSLERGWTVVVQAGNAERRDALDNHLWTYREASFLPHGLDGEPHAHLQPVLLTTGEGAANGATVRFLVDGVSPPPLEGYERVVFMFDGHDQQQLDEARAQWKALKASGHGLTYWQQSSGGRWERKA